MQPTFLKEAIRVYSRFSMPHAKEAALLNVEQGN
jgi:hypothetical protein